jgi:hypothetical protein
MDERMREGERRKREREREREREGGRESPWHWNPKPYSEL